MSRAHLRMNAINELAEYVSLLYISWATAEGALASSLIGTPVYLSGSHGLNVGK